jgi:hypothetical protein
MCSARETSTNGADAHERVVFLDRMLSQDAADSRHVAKKQPSIGTANAAR